MKFLLLSDLGMKPTKMGYMLNNNRSSGVLEVIECALNLGIESTNIDYWRKWDKNLLKSSILSWLNDESEPWIGLSGSIDGSSTEEFKELVHELKKDIPQLKVLLGGYRVPVGDTEWVDMAFIGRSINIFKDWLQGKDISKYRFSDSPPTYKNHYTIGEMILQDPVSPCIKEEDFFSPRETHTIELALGCKFNCSFCGYDFRNNKNPVIVQEEKVYNAIKTSYEKYGIKNFYLADDTINEVDDKLELLIRVVKQLDFEPEFMSFVRADVMAGRPHQIDLLQEAKIKNMYFGIESLNPEVAKMVRKGGNPGNVLNGLKTLKENYPEAVTFGSFIAGLSNDSEEQIRTNIQKVIDGQLLTGASYTPLRLYTNLENTDVMSDIDKNPKKFGYKVLDTEMDWPELGYSSHGWENDWTNDTHAEELANELNEYITQHLKIPLNTFEIFAMKAMLPDMEISAYKNMLQLHNNGTLKVIKQYIAKKSNWLVSN